MSNLMVLSLIFVIGLISAAAGNLIVTDYIDGKTHLNAKENTLLMGLYFIIPVCFITIFLIQQNIFSLIDFATCYFGLLFMFSLSVIDIKIQLIPNKILVYMVGVWAILTIIRIITDIDGAIPSILKSVRGALFSFIVFGLVYIITKKQLGGGDVKLSAVMGLYLTSGRIMGAILYGVILCALYSFVMLLMKKIGKKDALPLSPFLTVGYLITMMIKL